VRGEHAATPSLKKSAQEFGRIRVILNLMHWLVKLVIVTAGNAFALWLANRWIAGFVLTAPILGLILLALTLTILNFFLKPILTLVLGPIIIITLGLGLIIVNAIILWLAAYLSHLPQLDFIHGSITIQTIPALILATLLVSIVNFIIHVIV
jgi:putative membrane protein